MPITCASIQLTERECQVLDALENLNRRGEYASGDAVAWKLQTETRVALAYLRSDRLRAFGVTEPESGYFFLDPREKWTSPEAETEIARRGCEIRAYLREAGYVCSLVGKCRFDLRHSRLAGKCQLVLTDRQQWQVVGPNARIVTLARSIVGGVSRAVA